MKIIADILGFRKMMDVNDRAAREGRVRIAVPPYFRAAVRSAGSVYVDGREHYTADIFWRGEVDPNGYLIFEAEI